MVAAGLVGTSCRTTPEPLEDGLATQVRDAGPTEADALRPKVALLSKDVERLGQLTDEALWSHWTQGTPLDLAAAADAGVAVTPQALVTLRRARALGADDERALQHLERFVVGDLLARGVSDESAVVANLDASLTVSVDGKDVRWRELNRLLVNEKSALKRKALWAAGLKTAEQLDAAVAKREAKVKDVLASLDVPSSLEFAAESREIDLEALAQTAELLLEWSEDAWRATLKQLSDGELKLPAEALTRADLPRLMKVPAAVDAAFPKGQLAPRAIQTLGTLGLYGRPGLTLDLADAAKKNPLPLTVVPRLGDVRVSFRPLGGLRDQALLLSELGTALALLSSKTGRFETTRLGDPAITQLAGALLATLPAEDAWLEDMQVAAGDRPAIVRAWQAQQWLGLRRAAGTVLAKLETSTLPETEARARYVAIMARALGVKHTAEDGVRWRLDTDDFLRSATLLRTTLLAATLRSRLGPAWWRSPESGQTLLSLWAKGTSVSAEAQAGTFAQGLAAFVPERAELLPDAGVVKPFVVPARLGISDAGAPDGGSATQPAP